MSGEGRQCHVLGSRRWNWAKVLSFALVCASELELEERKTNSFYHLILERFKSMTYVTSDLLDLLFTDGESHYHVAVYLDYTGYFSQLY